MPQRPLPFRGTGQHSDILATAIPNQATVPALQTAQRFDMIDL
jgi:hypothetical protein